MIFKSYNLEKNIQSINNAAFLFYGENHGLKNEFKNEIKEIFKTNEIINLHQEEIIKDKNLLIKEVANKSLFADKKIVFINQVNDKILNIIEEIEKYLQEEQIFLFADILEKKSKLRSYFEKSENLGIVACYEDNEITIRKIITEKLKMMTGVTSGVVNQIIESTGFDRSKIQNEINKIISFFSDKKILENKLNQLLNDSSNDDFNDLKDEALNGNKNKTNKLISDTVLLEEKNIYYLNLINQRVNRLREINDKKSNNTSIETIVSNLKPPIFWKDKKIVINQAKLWDKNKLDELLNKTYKTEFLIKSNSLVKKDLLLKNLLVEICTTANSS